MRLMRPERLVLEGFTAFRDRVEIDFSDAELFALVGPTGSGKSSIVDAITFALYGSVPRLKKGRVEPIVSLGAERARVRFDFSVGGRSYTAARVVHRTKTGATTAEARLEGGPIEIVGASELTDAVERLLGLSYEHFTKCVVLPQGEFASFLLDGPKERQALLRELLDLGRFGRVRELAKQRATTSEANAEALRTQLDDLGDVTEGAIEEITDELLRVSDVVADVEVRAAKASELDSALVEGRRSISEREALLTRLRATELPEGVAKLAQETVDASTEVEAASTRLAGAAEQLERARKRASESGDASRVAERLAMMDRMGKLTERIEAGQNKMAEAVKQNDALEAEVEKLESAAGALETRLEALRSEHRAHALRAELDIGDECPVCHGVVAGDVDPAPEGIEEVGADADEARAAAAAARKRLIEAISRHQRDTEFLEGLIEERDEMRKLLGSDTIESLKHEKKRIDDSARILDEATTAVGKAQRELDTARRRLEELEKQSERFWSQLDTARTAVISAGPPEIRRKVLGAEWAAFVEWAGERAGSIELELASQREALNKLEQNLEIARQEITSIVTALDIELPAAGADPALALTAHRATLTERSARMKKDLDRKVKMAANLEGFEIDATVANSLVRHLNVNGFERWLIEEVLLALVASANELLEQLSQGSYSLAIERSDFWVVDHLNADERRAVETLSGGETFLVSLALALSLAEHLASMSVSGTAKLESVFLDEGFGTLDPETLDTVAAVIHELGAQGRTVGLITHVTELAHQIPIRFEVRKVSGSASVERVEL